MKHLIAIAGIVITVLSFVLGRGSDENRTETTSDLMRAPKGNVFDKLLGTWFSEERNLFECWTMRGKETYVSTVYKLSGKDTLIDERATIHREGGRWIFEVLANGQNEGKAVKFTSTFMAANSVQFSNPAHDFPNVICYSIPHPLELRAYIAGRNEKGGMDTISFNYKRYRK